MSTNVNNFCLKALTEHIRALCPCSDNLQSPKVDSQCLETKHVSPEMYRPELVACFGQEAGEVERKE